MLGTLKFDFHLLYLIIRTFSANFIMHFVANLNVKLNMEGYIFTQKREGGGGMKGFMY
jgi:hypothetical protein